MTCTSYSSPGLSPRVRGHPRIDRLNARWLRSIPACAGSPLPAVRRRYADEVYPRVCGVTYRGDSRVGSGRGLSPRVRGHHPGDRLAPHGCGSIPACAGSPYASKPHVPLTAVYPRVCGVTFCCSPPARPGLGLSPRVRGHPAPVRHRGVCGRSIPACAGSPRTCPRGGLVHRVYPRVCGVTWHQYLVGRAWWGLSPRVRGHHTATHGRRWSSRSIPACAGSPVISGHNGYRPWVYPRVCGVTVGMCSKSSRLGGLSPRVRGHHLLHVHLVGRSRSIPACAGSPPSLADVTTRRWVYPRVCGVTKASSVLPEVWRGLSPRVRGHLRAVTEALQALGSIPACAGSPPSLADVTTRRWVYPRVCGVTAPSTLVGSAMGGLSPRVRGHHRVALR